MDFMSLAAASAAARRREVDQHQRRRRTATGLTGTDYAVEKARRQGLDQPPAVRGRRRQRRARRPGRSAARPWPRTPSPSATCSTRQYSLTVGDISNIEQPGADRRRPHEAECRGPRQHGHVGVGGDPDGYTDEEPAPAWPPPTSPGSRPRSWSTIPTSELDPALLRAHLMATAIAHDDVTGKSNDYGLGRVSGYLAHWDHTNNDGWSNYWFYGGVSTAGGYAYGDITVPPGTKRLVVVLTWDEPAASAGASRAVTYDLDLWADQHRRTAAIRPARAASIASRLHRRQRRVHRRQQSAGRHVPVEGRPRQRPDLRGCPTAWPPRSSAATRRPSHDGLRDGSGDAPVVGSTFPVTMRVVDPVLRGVGRPGRT